MTGNKAKVSVNGNNNDVYVNSNIVMNTAVDEITKLVQSGDISEALGVLQRMKQSISGQHPAHPHWRYELTIGSDGVPTISHVATTADAAEKYPLRGSVSIIIPDEYRQFQDIHDLLKYSYQKQKPLEFDATAIKTFIGDIVIQDVSASDEQTLKVRIEPYKFPGPKPCKIYYEDDESSAFDFLEMQLVEIDGSTITIDNHNQISAKVTVTLEIDMDLLEGNLHLRIPDRYSDDLEAHYLLNQFLLSARKKRPFALKTLEESLELFSVKEWNVDDQSIPINQFESFVELLRKLRKIQSFFGVRFNMPKSNFSEEELETIELLDKSIKGEGIDGTFQDIVMRISSRETLQNMINMYEKLGSNDGLEIKVKFSNSIVQLLNASITVDREQTYNNAVIKEFNKLKRKFADMDEGDSISVTLIPGSNNKYHENYFPLNKWLKSKK